MAVAKSRIEITQPFIENKVVLLTYYVLSFKVRGKRDGYKRSQAGSLSFRRLSVHEGRKI